MIDRAKVIFSCQQQRIYAYLNKNWFRILADAREKMEAWRRYYNEDRAHDAIGYKLPIALMNSCGQPGRSPR